MLAVRGCGMRRNAAVAALLFLIAAILPAASREPLRGRHAMVASVSPIASKVGADIMKRGGNAVDAAVAVGLALAVTWPNAGNLGGGGFMVIRRADGTAEVIDYRERAPLAATRGMFVDAEGKVIPGLSLLGHRASAVPGSIAGLALAQQRHGKLKWSELVEPARKLAAEGFEVDHALATSLSDEGNIERFRKFPETARLFLPNGRPPAEGTLFRQPDLARTLERIRDRGPREFYEGETARLLVEEMKRGGGIITGEDLAQYEPTVRKPLRGTYRGLEIITMPPPSSGGAILIEMLNMLERFDVARLEHGSAAHMHLLTEVMRRAFADRATYMGDTDFVKGVPIQGLTSKSYAAKLTAEIDLTKASRSSDVKAGTPQLYQSPDTTHYSIIDADGTIVSNTTTLNDGYGSAVTVTGAGFLLNNEMDDFTSRPGTPNLYGLIQGEANAIAPRKRPLSSMSPTIVIKGGKPWFAVGARGGPTIINTTLQIIVNVVDFEMDLQEAIDAPRIHHQWLPDLVHWEPKVLNGDSRRLMERMGHRFSDKPGFIDMKELGEAHGVMIDGAGVRQGASDGRGGGAPAGY
jgi:gamma-glutamyltranspeptidase/glutathione hydrolase